MEIILSFLCISNGDPQIPHLMTCSQLGDGGQGKVRCRGHRGHRYYVQPQRSRHSSLLPGEQASTQLVVSDLPSPASDRVWGLKGGAGLSQNRKNARYQQLRRERMKTLPHTGLFLLHSKGSPLQLSIQIPTLLLIHCVTQENYTISLVPNEAQKGLHKLQLLLVLLSSQVPLLLLLCRFLIMVHAQGGRCLTNWWWDSSNLCLSFQRFVLTTQKFYLALQPRHVASSRVPFRFLRPSRLPLRGTPWPLPVVIFTTPGI